MAQDGRGSPDSPRFGFMRTPCVIEELQGRRCEEAPKTGALGNLSGLPGVVLGRFYVPHAEHRGIAIWDIIMKRFAVFALLGSLGLAGAALPASATEALPAAVAHRLDVAPAEFTASAAKMRRMQIIQDTMNRRRYDRRGRGYGRGYYGPGPRYGRGYGPRAGYYGRPGYSAPGSHPGTGYPPGYYGR